MPIEFLLRKKSSESLYRTALKNLIFMDGNVLILSTGYINNSTVWRNSESIKDFANWINSKNAQLTLIIVGGKNDTNNGYPVNYENFCKEVYNQIIDKTKIRIIFRRVAGDNWHSKVAVKLLKNTNEQRYYAALVGSSNLTPINILENLNSWSIESDLYIVDGILIKDSKLNKISETQKTIQICKKEIECNIENIKSCVKEINQRSNFAFKTRIGETTQISDEILLSLNNECVEELFIDPGLSKDLFIEILKSIDIIKSNKRIKDKITKALSSIKESGNNFYRCKNKLKTSYNNIFISATEILNNAINLHKKNEQASFEDFNDLYNQLKDFEKRFDEFKKANKDIIMQEFFQSLIDFREVVQTIRKDLLVFKSVYNLKIDGGYIESLIKSIYFEISDVINFFTKQVLSL